MKFYSEIYDSLFISTKENLILLEINEIFKKKVIPLLMEKKVPNFSYNFYLNTLKKNVCGFLVDNIVGKLVQGEYITPNKALQSTLNLDVLIIIQSLNKDALAKDVVNQTMYSSKIIKNIL